MKKKNILYICLPSCFLVFLSLVLFLSPSFARPQNSGSHVGGGSWPYGNSPSSNSVRPPYGNQPSPYGGGPYDYPSEDNVFAPQSTRRRGSGAPQPPGSRLPGRGTRRSSQGGRMEWEEDEEEMFVGEGGEGEGAEPAAMDPVDLYCSRTSGKLAVTLASSITGTALGAALSQAFIHRPTSCAVGGLIIGFLLSFMKNDFGVLFRALGLMLIYILERNSRAGTQYSALRQLRPALRLAPRRPFPPVENPWAYVRASEADMEFSMTKSLIAISFIGSLLGWIIAKMINLFFVPIWLLALAGGGLFGYTATLRDPRGDMVRCLGMKIVAFMALLKSLDEELSVLGKLGKVFHISYGHMARLDQRFKVRERIWALSGFFASRFNKEAQRVRSDMSSTTAGRGRVDPSAPAYDDVFGNDGYTYDERPSPYNPESSRGYGGGYSRGR